MEIYQDYGNDLLVNANGDLQTADEEVLSNQRIIRRLITIPISVSPIPDYLQQPTYGCGLGQFIGQLLTPEIFNQITGLITSQMYLETSVAQNPPPVIQITGLPNIINCTITYNNLLTNKQSVINFTFPPNNTSS